MNCNYRICIFVGGRTCGKGEGKELAPSYSQKQ
jgi:hypothetical protein